MREKPSTAQCNCHLYTLFLLAEPRYVSCVRLSDILEELSWRIEGLFLTVTQNFECEIETLAYPKAALFSFSLALVTYNILATLKAALASVHGVETIEATVSDFYLVDELQGTYRGMMIAIPSEHWQPFRTLALAELAVLLKQLAAQVDLKRFLKRPRKSKSKTPPRVRDPKHPHVSTARFLSPG